jgi:hypothetical protein
MAGMKPRAIFIIAAVPLFIGGAAFGQQMTPPGWSQFNPPLPAGPPPPRIEVPVVPRLNEAQQPRAPSAPRRSFSDKVTRCLDDAAGLGPKARAAYSRNCANRD